ncbi:MAG: TonB-dependent receptor [Bacteroidetes bacterium]|nr:TonB-dependent receptor [Bacteroidota bacterium]
MKKYIFIFLILWQIIPTQGQTTEGHVMEAVGESTKPLPGANVVQLNTTNGTVTDASGHFELKLISESPKILVISYISYQSDTVDLSKLKQNHVHVVLSSVKNLSEVEITSRQGAFLSRTATRNITEINQAELQKAACCNLSESFENSAAVDVSYSDAVTGAKQIQLLGLAGIYTQFLTENIPNMRGLATPYGLGYVPGSWMESIQVSKGTSAVNNGYESMAGQINIEYKKPDEGDRLFVNMYGNHEGKAEANLVARMPVTARISTALLAHAEYFRIKHDRNDDGFLDMPLVNQINLMNRWKYQGKALHTQLGVQWLSEERQGGQMSFSPNMTRDVDHPYGIGVKTNRYEAFLKVGYVFEHRAATSFGFQNQMIIHDQNAYFGLNNYDARQVSYYGNLMFQSWLFHSKHQFTTGLSFMLDNYYEVLNDSTFNRHEKVPGAFVQYSYSNQGNFNVIVGLRIDEHNLYGTLFTPRIHARYNLNEHNLIRISAGKGYRSPNVIAENTSILATSKRLVIAPDLKIESSWNYGLSYTTYLDVRAREWRITADFFRTDFINQVIMNREAEAFSVYFYNLNGQSYSNSFQLETNYELLKNLDVTLAFRYNDVKTTLNDQLIEKPLVNKYKGLVSLSYVTSQKKWQMDANIQLNGDQRIPYTGFNPAEYQLKSESPAYVVINAQITRFFKRWEVYLGAENLTNYTQNNPIIAADDPFGKYFDSSIIWGPVSGIKVYAGFRFMIKE